MGLKKCRNELNMQIGSRIKTARESTGLKQHQLAEKVGVSTQHISALECGRNRPSYETLILLCQALHVTCDYLISGNEDNQEPNTLFNWIDHIPEQLRPELKKSFYIINDVLNDPSIYNSHTESTSKPSGKDSHN